MINPPTGQMWYGNPAPAVAPGGAAPAATPILGQPLTMGPAAPGGGGSPILGATGPQMPVQPSVGGGGIMSSGWPQVLAAGALSFLGGYRRNPGMVNMGNAILNQYAQQTAANEAEAALRQVTRGVDMSDPESLREGAQRALDNGMLDVAKRFTDEARSIDEFRRADEKTQLDLAAPQLKRAQAIKFVNEQANRAIDRVGGDVSRLNELERLAITTQFVQTQMPGVLSDSEYNRAAGAGDVNGAINAIKKYIGMPPGAAPDDVIRAMINQTEDAARQADDYIRWVDQNSRYDLSGLLRPVKSRGVRRPDTVANSIEGYDYTTKSRGASSGAPSSNELMRDLDRGAQSLWDWFSN